MPACQAKAKWRADGTRQGSGVAVPRDRVRGQRFRGFGGTSLSRWALGGARLQEEHLEPELALAEDEILRRGAARLEQLADGHDEGRVLPAEEVDRLDQLGVEEHEHLRAQRRAELLEDHALGADV